jgi:filamentous hemagglutinin
LTLGISLSAEQMARLTSDLVWLEYVTVETDQGPMEVLAPKVYLAPGRESLISPGGALLSAKAVVMDLEGGFENSGAIYGGQGVQVAAADIDNLGGTIAGKLVSLAALRDVNNVGGNIKGLELVSLTAGRDINIASRTQTTTTEGARHFGSRTAIDQVGTVLVTSGTGRLDIQAGRDVNLAAALVGSAGSGAIAAGGDLNVGTVESSYEYKSWSDAKNSIHEKQRVDVGSQIEVVGDLSLTAGNDLKVTGSQVNSAGHVALLAGNDVSITEGRSQSFVDEKIFTKESGALNTKTSTYEGQKSTDNALGSTVSGASVSIVAGEDVDLRAFNVTAVGDLKVEAGGDINVSGAENYSESESRSVHTRSGFSAAFKDSGLGFTVTAGKSEDGRTSANQRLGHTASNLTSQAGDISLYAGGDATVSGSQVTAALGDILISGENVTIDSQFNSTDEQSRTWSKFVGLTLDAGLTGPVVSLYNAVMSLPDKIAAVKNSNNGQIQALNGIVAGRSVLDILTGPSAIKNAVEQGQTTAFMSEVYEQLPNLSNAQYDDIAGYFQNNNLGELANILGDDLLQDGLNNSVFGGISSAVGLSAKLSFGASSTEEKRASSQSTATGGAVSSGGHTTLQARGDGSGGEGDLTIIGSTVNAGGKVNLLAENDINLLSAAETRSSENSRKSTSASLGAQASIGSKGIGISIEGQFGYGRGEGASNSLTHKETIINGTEGVNFVSGEDTTLKGALMTGDSIVGQVGGNLNIISEQDSQNAYQESLNVSGGFSIPVYGAAVASANFSYSSQDAESSYLSVNEQSGIKAGQGGFDLTVGEQTSLVGAVIDSEASPDKNSLSTGTLVVADLYNNSNYSAETSGLSIVGTANTPVLGTTYTPNPTTTQKPPAQTAATEAGQEAAEPGFWDKLSNNVTNINGSATTAFPLSEEGRGSSVTRSAIASGAIVITDSAAQIALTGQDPDAFIAALNRDTANAHSGVLDQNPNLQMLLGSQSQMQRLATEANRAVLKTIGEAVDLVMAQTEYGQAGQAQKDAQNILYSPTSTQAEKEAAQLAYDAAKVILSNEDLKAEYNQWGQNGDYRVIMNIVGTAVVSELGNGEGVQAALGAAAGILAAKEGSINAVIADVAKNLAGDGTKTEEFLNKVISKRVMGLIAQAFGGETGEYAYDATAPKPTPAPKPATGSEASTGAQTMSQNRQ